MVRDVTNPRDVRFVQYLNKRNFAGDAEAGTAGDLGPKGFHFHLPEGQPDRRSAPRSRQRDQRNDHALPHRRPTLTRRAGVAYAPVQMTTPVRTWWAWRRERSGSVAC
jgi:hypothetical protein